MIRRAGRWLTAIAITTGAIGAIGATSFSAAPMALGAVTPHTLAAGRAAVCRQGTIHWSVDQQGSGPLYEQTSWNYPNCKGLWQEAKIRCVDRTASQNFYGPKRTQVGRVSQVQCPSQWQLACAATRWQGGSQWQWPTGHTCSARAHATLTAARRINCTEVSAGSVNLSTAHAAVWWRHNTTDCEFYIRVRLLCANRFNGSKYVYGGFVESLFPVQSGATCPPDFSSLQFVWQQVKFSATGSKHTCERYPSDQCGSAGEAYGRS